MPSINLAVPSHGLHQAMQFGQMCAEARCRKRSMDTNTYAPSAVKCSGMGRVKRVYAARLMVLGS